MRHEGLQRKRDYEIGICGLKEEENCLQGTVLQYVFSDSPTQVLLKLMSRTIQGCEGLNNRHLKVDG